MAPEIDRKQSRLKSPVGRAPNLLLSEEDGASELEISSFHTREHVSSFSPQLLFASSLSLFGSSCPHLLITHSRAPVSPQLLPNSARGAEKISTGSSPAQQRVHFVVGESHLDTCPSPAHTRQAPCSSQLLPGPSSLPLPWPNMRWRRSRFWVERWTGGS